MADIRKDPLVHFEADNVMNAVKQSCPVFGQYNPAQTSNNVQGINPLLCTVSSNGSIPSSFPTTVPQVSASIAPSAQNQAQGVSQAAGFTSQEDLNSVLQRLLMSS